MDPVDGGSCNQYDYACQDPIDRLDLSGTVVLPGWAQNFVDIINGGVQFCNIVCQTILGGDPDGEANAVRNPPIRGPLVHHIWERPLTILAKSRRLDCRAMGSPVTRMESLAMEMTHPTRTTTSRVRRASARLSGRALAQGFASISSFSTDEEHD